MRYIKFSLALAAACLATNPALAADAKLAWGDLDLATEAGKAELDHRIEAAARQVCAPQAVTGSRIVRRNAPASCLAEARSTLAAQVAARLDRRVLAEGKTQNRTADAAR